MESRPKGQVVECGRKIVLIGNPNVGKSAFFQALTGTYAVVSNFPGTTVSLTKGRLGKDVVIDTPGVYGISSESDEERVTRDVVLEADLVVNVVDATRLERDLFLTLQLVEMGVPLVVVLNMADDVPRAGLRIDVTRLSMNLGVDVIETIAPRGVGLPQVRESFARARTGRVETATTTAIQELVTNFGISRAEAVLALEDDGATLATRNLPPRGRKAEIFAARRQRQEAILRACVSRTGAPAFFGARLSDLMIHPVFGMLILAFVLFLFYQIVGVFFAQTLVGFTEETVMQGMFEPFVRSLVEGMVPLDSALGRILAGEFGVATMAVTYLVGLLLPLVVGFYLFLSVLEDTGYLPRLAALSDGLMTKIGLNGRAMIPFILGFGCVTAALLTTRILSTKKERTIASILLVLAVPCSAQIAVVTVLLAALGPFYTAVYVLVMLAIFSAAGVILHRLIPGVSSGLLLDLPRLRLPHPVNVLKKTGVKTAGFMMDAVPLFLLGALTVSVLEVTGSLEVIQGWMAPLVENWLRLPREAATAFLMGFVRRDFGTAGLLSLSLTPWQSIVAVITITLFVPCIASTFVLYRERGWRQASVIWAGAIGVAFSIGGLLAHLPIP